MSSASEPRPGRSEQAGFSLLEVVIALAVVALIMGVLLAIIPGQAVQTRARLDRLIATEFAFSLMEEYRVTYPLMAPHGDDPTGWSWQIAEREYRPDTPEVLGDLILYVEVEVTVWRSDVPEMKSSLSTLVARPRS